MEEMSYFPKQNQNYSTFIEQKILKKKNEQKNIRNFQIRPYMKLPLTIL